MPDTDRFPPIQFFDPCEEYLVVERKLPHWAQAGTFCFITWRTWDSMPRAVLEVWLAEREAWLRRHGINPRCDDWRRQVVKLPVADQRDFHRNLSSRWESCLDDCHGACVLRQPPLAGIVADSLKHFDGDRYFLSDFVIMPNHVHLLVAFPDPLKMLTQCNSWKHYTAVRLNQALGRRGRFWEVDGFDHLVRSREQLEYLRGYIRENPNRANLRPGEFRHYSRDLTP